MDKDPEVNLVKIPLKQFTVGQHLYVKHTIMHGFPAYILCEFLGIERGLVKVKYIEVNTPDYFHLDRWFEKKHPNFIGRVRASSCYLWGQDNMGKWNRCHWFKNINDPVYQTSKNNPQESLGSYD